MRLRSVKAIGNSGKAELIAFRVPMVAGRRGIPSSEIPGRFSRPFLNVGEGGL
jgi:hypothetical protein